MMLLEDVDCFGGETNILYYYLLFVGVWGTDGLFTDLSNIFLLLFLRDWRWYYSLNIFDYYLDCNLIWSSCLIGI